MDAGKRKHSDNSVSLPSSDPVEPDDDQWLDSFLNGLHAKDHCKCDFGSYKDNLEAEDFLGVDDIARASEATLTGKVGMTSGAAAIVHEQAEVVTKQVYCHARETKRRRLD